MTATVDRPAPDAAPPAAPNPLASDRRPSPLRPALTPNWFAAVMGTGIVAVAAESLPVQVPGRLGFAQVVWALAAALLVVLLAVAARDAVTRHQHHLDPVMSHFYGAPPMAMLTIGAGALLAGTDVIGTTAALAVDWTLWFAGTLTGLVTAVGVPYLQFTRHEVKPGDAFGGWLMPVVPPMVSASTGALLVPYAPAGQAREALLLACYAMFGLSLLASIVVITLIWYRLAVHDTGPAAMVPTLWIVLGPLGQSITAVNLLGAAADQVLPAPYASALDAFGVVYGVPVWGFAMLWAVVAAAITIRTVRTRMPFALTWWSFTFPVGTVVTGTSALWLHTDSVVFRWTAVAFYVGLLGAWLTVATRTARGCVRREL